MVTSINGNNVTWKDNKTGELITDPHNDLELMMQKGRKINRKRKQHGGNFRPKGLVQRGSGDIDPNSQYGLPVDDVDAIIGRGEYVVNKNAVDAVGEEFLDNLNSIGIGNPSNIPRGTGKYGGYQRGGKVKPKPVRKQRGGRTNGRNTVKRQRGGRTRPVRRQRGGRGRKRFQRGGHSHDFNHSHAVLTSPDYLLESEFTDMWTGDLIEGTAVMGGAHPRGAGQSVLSGNGNGKINNRLRRQTGSGGYVFASTGLPYHGKVIDVGGATWSTTGNTKVATSQKVILKNDYNKNRPK